MYLTSNYNYFYQGGIESMAITEVFGGKHSIKLFFFLKSQWHGII